MWLLPAYRSFHSCSITTPASRQGMSANKSPCWFGKFIRATATEADPVSSPRRCRPLDRRRDSNDFLPDRLSLRHVNFFRLFAIKFDEGPLQVVEEGVT